MVPGSFLAACVLWARRDQPVSARSIVMKPRCGGLQRAKGIAVTEFGPVAIGWRKREDGPMEFNVDCPQDCRALVRLHHCGRGASLTLDGALRV